MQVMAWGQREKFGSGFPSRPISTQDVGGEVALDVGIDVDGWARAGVRMDCSGRVAHIGSGGASVGVVGCK